MRAFFRGAVLASGLYAAACALTTDLNDFSNGADAGGVPDTGVAPPPPSTTTMQPVPPVPVDAGDAGDDGGCDAGYCGCLVPKRKFCDDFDHGGTANGYWNVYSTVNAIHELDAGGLSAPNLFEIQAGLDAGGTSVARIGSHVTTTTSSAGFNFDIRFDNIPATSATLCRLTFLDGAPLGAQSVYLSHEMSGFQIGAHAVGADGGSLSFNTYPFVLLSAIGSWHHFDLLVSVAASAPKLTVLLDGALLVEKVLGAGFVPANVDFVCGLDFANVTGQPWRYAIDNLVFDYTP